MALFDFFKKKKKPKKVEKEVEKVEKKVEPKKEVKAKKEVKPGAPRPKKKVLGAYEILSSPHVTEKATQLSEAGKYVFKVSSRTNKVEIKKAVEGTYNVEVESVRIINVPKKQRRLGRQKGWRRGYKKAIVELKKGQKIEILPR